MNTLEHHFRCFDVNYPTDISLPTACCAEQKVSTNLHLFFCHQMHIGVTNESTFFDNQEFFHESGGFSSQLKAKASSPDASTVKATYSAFVCRNRTSSIFFIVRYTNYHFHQFPLRDICFVSTLKKPVRKTHYY